VSVSSKTRRVLVVDDEIDITSIFKSALEAHGFSVDAFTDPREALEHFKPNFYDISILDIKMPHMTGFQLSRAMIKIDKDTRICFVTAFEIYEKEARAMLPSLSSFCFIKKPISVSALVEHIRSHLAA
jgi:two-component system OmpR family response regulator